MRRARMGRRELRAARLMPRERASKGIERLAGSCLASLPGEETLGAESAAAGFDDEEQQTSRQQGQRQTDQEVQGFVARLGILGEEGHFAAPTFLVRGLFRPHWIERAFFCFPSMDKHITDD